VPKRRVRTPRAVRPIAERQRDGLQISSINSCLRALRRVLRLAVEWGVLESSPKVKFFSGEHRRERVISAGEEVL
jgi:hypothetical protein